MKIFLKIFICSLLLCNFYGCVAVLFGAAGGAGTAVWLSGKLAQQVPSTYENTIRATKEALKSMNLEIIKESKTTEIAQIRSHYGDGRKIWIDIHPIGEDSSGIEVRVGVFGDKVASDVLIRKIISKL